MEKEKYIESFGSLPFVEDVRDYRLKKSIVKAEVFPEEFTLVPPKVKNQGAVGSCVAHAIAETVEYHNREQEKTNTLMSTGFIYGNRRNSLNKSSGMFIREALSNTCKYGTTTQKEFFENAEVPKAINLFEERFDELKDKAFPNRLSTYFRLISDADIKHALMNYGPVVFAMTWREGIHVDSKGILQVDPTRKATGGHCMIIYGWTKDGWKIQNSWGVKWGNKGYAILPFDAKKSEAWGVTDEVVNGKGDIKKPFNTTFMRWIAKIFNWIVNLFKKGNK